MIDELLYIFNLFNEDIIKKKNEYLYSLFKLYKNQISKIEMINIDINNRMIYILATNIYKFILKIDGKFLYYQVVNKIYNNNSRVLIIFDPNIVINYYDNINELNIKMRNFIEDIKCPKYKGKSSKIEKLIYILNSDLFLIKFSNLAIGDKFNGENIMYSIREYHISKLY
uniref:Uncharacterized protein n=1 Tax=Pithovirus LCDPAC02 TaxID=2506601 RepID=A0A481YPV1_9VIRU|nr:MAG: hypothetical protein LCDPAC02_02290 [Pithovirus LCDPAC02]